MDRLLRMIDANANRAREGLRVLEDVARFGLDAGDLVERLKAARHGLTKALAGAGLTRGRLVVARDTAGDVGTAIKGAGEGERNGLAGLVSAAAGRAGEALRVIEEALKTLPGGRAGAGWRAVEAARYAVYEVERELTLRLPIVVGGADRQAAQWPVCVLVTESLCKRPWTRVVEDSLAAGAACIQIREKALSDRELLKRIRWTVAAAERIRPKTERKRTGGKNGLKARSPRAAVIVNDRVDIAVLGGADGVHLGQDDLPVAEARGMMLRAGVRLLVGVSTHDLEEARRAWRDGADYVGVGAMFPTATKRRETSGVAYLRAFLRESRRGWAGGSRGGRVMPHLAIGGITPGNVGALVRAGCRGVAVSGVVCGADRPGRVCREIVEMMSRGRAV
jgi:thiamine-phosphate pyrophosphorylase